MSNVFTLRSADSGTPAVKTNIPCGSRAAGKRVQGRSEHSFGPIAGARNPPIHHINCHSDSETFIIEDQVWIMLVLIILYLYWYKQG